MLLTPRNIVESMFHVNFSTKSLVFLHCCKNKVLPVQVAQNDPRKVYKGGWLPIDVCKCKRVISKLFVKSFVVKSSNTTIGMYYCHMKMLAVKGSVLVNLATKVNAINPITLTISI